jgi:hypothetical protein
LPTSQEEHNDVIFPVKNWHFRIEVADITELVIFPVKNWHFRIEVADITELAQ